jgi:hypothetical protein
MKPQSNQKIFYSNVYGLKNVLSFANTKYLVLFIDDYNGFKFFYCIKTEGEFYFIFCENEGKKLVTNKKCHGEIQK